MTQTVCCALLSYVFVTTTDWRMVFNSDMENGGNTQDRSMQDFETA